MSKKWITFDLDGTLMQNPFVEWVFPGIQSQINEKLPEKQDVIELLVEYHEKLMADNRTYEAYDWDSIVNEAIKEYGLQDKLQIDVEDLVKKHSVKPKVYLLEEGIVDTLKELKKMGYSLAVVTNGYYKYQFPVLKALEIDNLFDEIITPETSKCSKPNPEILKSIMDKGEVVAHIGDRIDHDIVMTNTLGITSVLINKNLPDNYRDIPFHERAANVEILSVCKEKWQQEKNNAEFHENCVPNIVIGSILELPKYFSL